MFAGLWFGASKPHFQTFLQPFTHALNDLFHKGVLKNNSLYTNV